MKKTRYYIKRTEKGKIDMTGEIKKKKKVL